MTTTHDRLVAAAHWLSDGVDKLVFSEPVTHVYNPLRYAWDAHHRYLKLAPETQAARVLFLGMNPGPWGMAQTGVPFGQVEAVRDWLGIDVPVGKPAKEHPKRPIEGFACRRSEVSGERLWALPRPLRRSVRILSRALRRQLLPARLHGGDRPQPNPRQAAFRRTGTA